MKNFLFISAILLSLIAYIHTYPYSRRNKHNKHHSWPYKRYRHRNWDNNWPYNQETYCTKNCPHVYKPVCGIDNNTYYNDCYIQCKDVRKLKDGRCDVGCLCSYEYKPVCGTDGKTYRNDCQRECEGAGLKRYGACDGGHNHHSCYCSNEYNPVCSNGKTYSNSCFAICDKETNWTYGACKYYESKCDCGHYFNEVCGTDGRIYKNSCFAACANVGVTYKDFCE